MEAHGGGQGGGYFRKHSKPILVGLPSVCSAFINKAREGRDCMGVCSVCVHCARVFMAVRYF